MTFKKLDLINFLPSSKRLTYKILSIDDLSSFGSLAGNSYIREYLMEGMEVTTDDCLKWIDESNKLFKEKNVGLYLVYENDSLVGYAGFSRAHERIEDIEVLFAFPKKHSGKGFATEVCGALVHLFKSNLRNVKLVAVAHPKNTASVHVLKKCGFVSIDSSDGDLSHLLHFEQQGP
jgi:RimJ/RimL family protein N-acetyltransferase